MLRTPDVMGLGDLNILVVFAVRVGVAPRPCCASAIAIGLMFTPLAGCSGLFAGQSRRKMAP